MKAKIKIALRDNPYEVVLGKIKKIEIPSKIFIVSSQRVATLFLEYLLTIIHATDGNDVTTCIIEDGEEHKNMETINYILDCAFKAKLNRNSIMIALGGGVISDMVGFASGIYQRGIDFISIPTTLLAMVDASVGGKCGINNQYGKNLIGLFHQPKKVYVDSMFLRTLPQREFNAGLAEMIKVFACFEYSFLQNFNLRDIEFYIQRSIEIKAYIVQQDEREKGGPRVLLNYGHTFGHAIELETKYGEYLHGEAVSMGIVMANRLSVRLGILSDEIANFIESLLQKCDLPTRYEIRDIESFYQSFFMDKKSLDSKLNFVLLESKGMLKAKLHKNISKEIIMEVLEEFRA